MCILVIINKWVVRWRESERENLSGGGECYFSCIFWAFVLVFVNLLFFRVFSFCFFVILKVFCWVKRFKIFSIFVLNLSWLFYLYLVWRVKVCISVGGEFGCIGFFERGEFVFNMVRIWEIFSRIFLLCGIFVLIVLCNGFFWYFK